MKRLLLTACVVFAVLSPAAARKPKRLSASAAPAWLREAARLEVEGDLAAAETVLLHDELVVEPLATGGVRLARRQALRVLKPEGFFVFTVELFPEQMERDPAHPHSLTREDVDRLLGERFARVFEASAPWIGMGNYLSGQREGDGREELILVLQPA